VADRGDGLHGVGVVGVPDNAFRSAIGCRVRNNLANDVLVGMTMISPSSARRLGRSQLGLFDLPRTALRGDGVTELKHARKNDGQASAVIGDGPCKARLKPTARPPIAATSGVIATPSRFSATMTNITNTSRRTVEAVNCRTVTSTLLFSWTFNKRLEIRRPTKNPAMMASTAPRSWNE